MKKILLFLLVIVSFQAFGQGDYYKGESQIGEYVFYYGQYGIPTNYQYRTVRERMIASMRDSSDHLPRYNSTPVGLRVGSSTNSGAVAIDTINHTGFFYSGEKWRNFGSQSFETKLVNGGIVTWDSLLVFSVSPAIYYINGAFHTSSLTSLPLDAAHATLDRIDLIYLDSTGAHKLSGDAAATPAEPNLPINSIRLTAIQVPALATVPGGTVDTLLVYDQNVEFTVSASAATADADNFTAPYHYTKAVSVGAIGLLSNISFTSTATYSKSNYNSLRFFVRLKSAFASTCRLVIYFRNNGVTTSSGIVLSNGVYGFSRTNASTYQEIIIPMADFGFTSNDFDAIMFQSTGVNANGFYLDWITLTGGINQETTHPNSFGFVQTTSGNAISTQPNDLVTFVGAGGVTTSATGKTVTITGSGGSQTLQQVFDVETGEALLNKNDTINVAGNVFHIRSAVNGSTITSIVSGNVTVTDQVTGSSVVQQAVNSSNTYQSNATLSTGGYTVYSQITNAGQYSDVTIMPDSILLKPNAGKINIDSLRTGTSADEIVTWRAGMLSKITAGAAKGTQSKGLTLETPGAAESFGMWQTQVAITVSSIKAVVLGSGSPSVTINIAFGTDRTSGTNVFSSGTAITNTTTGQTLNSGFNDATIPAGSFIWFISTAQSGTVTQIEVTINYTED